MDIWYTDFESIIKNIGYNGFGSGSESETKPEGCNGKTVYEIAKEVIQEKWGNGQDRINQLTAAGCDYETIQEEVNRILGL